MKTTEQEFSKHVSVPSGEGVRVDKTITIERPTALVYSFWKELENLPRFMRHVQSVEARGDLQSHWKVKGPAGRVVEWDAEIIEQRENEMMSWRSTPGSGVDNAGSVWFTPIPGSMGTIVRVELKYLPPAGKTGDFVAGLFGGNAESVIEEDLTRMKSLLETGRLPEDQDKPGPAKRVTEALTKGYRATDRCVHENAWSAIGSVALASFTFGLLLGCRTARSSRED